MKITIDIPDKIYKNMENPFKDEEQLKTFFVGKLYETGRLSGYECEQILEMDRWDFIEALGSCEIPYYNPTKEEARKDLETAERFFNR